MPKRSSIEKSKSEVIPKTEDFASDARPSDTKNPHAMALGSRGGKVGGRVRAQRLTASRRQEIASKAAIARWQSRGTSEASELRSPRASADTRQLILKAAHEEFKKYGLAGGRVDRIAKRAGVNKRMLYHYFIDKEALFREMLRRNLMQLSAAEAATPQELSESLVYWQSLVARNPDWMRLSMWEELNYGSGGIIAEPERRGFWQTAVQEIRREQLSGNIRLDLDPEMLQLCLLAVVAFPIALPHLASVVTGLAPGSPEFHRRQDEFLRSFGKLLAPVKQK